MSREKYLNKIQKLVSKIYEDISNGKEPTLKIPKRTLSNVVYKDGYLLLGNEHIQRRLLDKGEVKEFVLTLLIFDTIAQAIREDDYPTIRDIYYTIKHTITYKDARGREIHENTVDDQSESDAVIEDTEVLLGELRENLGITYDAKGRASGNVIIKAGGDKIDLAKMGTGAWAIPSSVDDIKFESVNAKFVLVVEKGAIFERLNAERVWKNLNCVLVTGKGQPDRGTRRFVRRLHDEFGLPVYVLVDGDSYGWYIYSVYAHGSIKLSFESSRLAIPDAKMLGVWASDIYSYKIPKRYIIKATEADIKRAKELLNYPWFANDKKWNKEIKLFLEKKEKIEIEGFSGFGLKFLSEKYIPDKLKEYGVRI